MTGPTKLLLATVLTVALAAVVALWPKAVDRPSGTAPADAENSATLLNRASGGENAGPSSTGHRPSASALEETTEMLFRACAMAHLPIAKDAAARALACSKALQSRQLAPDQIALARLTRGVARTLLGNRELAGEDYLDTVRRYDQLIDPTNPDALMLYRRAVALEASGQTDKALEDYGAAVKADPMSTMAFLGRGVLLAGRKRAYERAIDDFDKVLALQPNSVDALIARGDAFSNLGSTGRAMADLNRAISLSPERADAYLARGLAEARKGDARAALSDYKETLRLDPHNVHALINLAALDCLEANYTAAIAKLDTAIAIDQEQARAFYNRGYARFALRQYDKAIADYDVAIRLEPGLGVAYVNRALARTLEGWDLVKALADSDEALKLQPLNLDIRETRGFIYLKLGDPALALHEYDLALDADPQRALALYGRGVAKIGVGNVAAGKLDQASAETLNPGVAREFAAYGL
jgi:tetratricopeptide (TPR) repeat protein